MSTRKPLPLEELDMPEIDVLLASIVTLPLMYVLMAGAIMGLLSLVVVVKVSKN